MKILLDDYMLIAGMLALATAFLRLLIKPELKFWRTVSNFVSGFIFGSLVAFILKEVTTTTTIKYAAVSVTGLAANEIVSGLILASKLLYPLFKTFSEKWLNKKIDND